VATNFVVAMSRLEFYLKDGRRINVRTMPFRESAQQIADNVQAAAKSGDPGPAGSTT
jgi:hypothetical protein